MAKTIEMPVDLVERIAATMEICVDELTAQHLMRFGHLDHLTHIRLREKIEQDRAVSLEASTVLLELHEFLEQQNLHLIE